jgi:DNA-binding response OmpR family regulator/predicted Ser/Thr protein kinase
VSLPRILIAGTDTATLKRLSDILAPGGYEVKVSPPEELLPLAQSQPPDLLILADALAEEPHLLQQLKGGPLTREIPIILAPSHFDYNLAAQGLEWGADEFLLPPFSPPNVLARVAVVLKLKHDQQLILASQEEFSRLFQENVQPLFYCDREGTVCHLNPSLRRLLGYPGQRDREELLPAADLLYDQADRERFAQLLTQPAAATPFKMNLKDRQGKAVTVLLKSLAPPPQPTDQTAFQVQPVGTTSPLKKALRGLVQHFLPGARDYLALLSMTPLLGGRYEKVKKLGQGSFGEVWLVLDTETLGPERQYVAKIPFSKAANPKFRKEAEICRKLSPHPGVANLVATLEDEGRVILIQEYVAGETLGDRLGEELPQPLLENLILQLIEVVAHAHRQRVMHRDIKPNNIIVQPDGTLTLLDYGAAKILKEKDISATMVGSRPFMAPEQIMGKSERRSDIWAIGVLMYLLYTGELPFYSEVEKLLIDQILEQEPVPPRELNPEIPPPLEKIILRCLKKKVEERYPQALALKADLLKHFPQYGAKPVDQPD